MRCAIVPPYLLLRIARVNDPALQPAAEAARRALVHDEPFRSQRTEAGPGGGPSIVEHRVLPPNRTVSDAENTETLPGRVARSEGDPAGEDVTVNEAYEGLGLTHELFGQVFSRASIDDANMGMDATVHYGDAYDNAFWNGERMVFGDGDGQVFSRFTSALSVIGHELAHGVIQHTANLTYSSQSGALNESIADVFGALVEQHALEQDADAASWLIGEGIFTSQVEGRALRSMAEPGTAYDDDVLGRDPQPAHMDDYINTKDDNGGVHLNSGIPNRAFYLVATTLGGYAWDQAGRIWYDALTGDLPADADFARFAQATTDAAAARFGEGSAERAAVADAWLSVGVTR
ncbi:M4 family metallopeptidase [Diaminobutyricimonas sp. TR449]|uniref:M4 family metallopeptidase n=1 Tax=Diaminobutyricimonas sp. TR449 TaxID=2708076 RepID=UPI00142463EB|nr:M4 family metallopeptidase [Diaminobutyricimonas sp. TR449]